MEVLKLKSWHISSIKTISTCASSGKRMRFWTFTDAFVATFVSFKRFRRVVTFYNRAPSNAVASPSCLQIYCDYN